MSKKSSSGKTSAKKSGSVKSSAKSQSISNLTNGYNHSDLGSKSSSYSTLVDKSSNSRASSKSGRKDDENFFLSRSQSSGNISSSGQLAMADHVFRRRQLSSNLEENENSSVVSGASSSRVSFAMNDDKNFDRASRSSSLRSINFTDRRFVVPDDLIVPLNDEGHSELNEEEKLHLEDVLERAEEQLEIEERRKKRLSKELEFMLTNSGGVGVQQWLGWRKSVAALRESSSRRSSIRSSFKQDLTSQNICHVCNTQFGFVDNLLKRPRLCLQCDIQTCHRCVLRLRADGSSEPHFLCQFCYSENCIEGQSGEWFNILLRRSRRDLIGGPDILRASMRRHLEKEESAKRSAEMVQQTIEEQLSLDRSMPSQDNSASDEVQKSRKYRFIRKSKKSHSNDVIDLNSRSHSITTMDSVPEDEVPALHHEAVHLDQPSHEDMPKNEEKAEESTEQPPIMDDEEAFDNVDPSSDGQVVDIDVHRSMMSIYSETDESYAVGIQVSGELLFGLEYDYSRSIFTVSIRGARNLAAVDVRKKRSDPLCIYIKTYLLPDKTKSSKRKTSHKKNTLDPTFSEDLKYNIPKSTLESRTLQVTAWHHETLGHNIFLGECRINLCDYKFQDTTPQWHKLHEKKQVAIPLNTLIYKGDLIFAIKYIPPQADVEGELHVWIKEARNLEPAHSGGLCNPYVKAYLLPEKSRKSCRKTNVVRHSLSPNWNTHLQFIGVLPQDLQDRSLELCVCDRGRFGSSDFLGGLRLNLGLGLCQSTHAAWMDSCGNEVIMWQALINRHNQWIEGAIQLRPNLDC